MPYLFVYCHRNGKSSKEIANHVFPRIFGCQVVTAILARRRNFGRFPADKNSAANSALAGRSTALKMSPRQYIL